MPSGKPVLTSSFLDHYTCIVKLVLDKIGPADRIQILALLKNIKHYLELYEVSADIKYDDPLVSVSNLIHSIEDVNIVKQTVKGLQGSAKGKTSTVIGFATAASPHKTLFSSGTNILASHNPPVSRRAGVKRPPPSDSGGDNDDGDVYEHSNESDGNDYGDDVPQQVEEVVIQDDTEWQPIDMLERALTAIANEQTKAVYVFDGDTNQSSDKKTKKKNLRTKWNQPKLYLPEDVEFANPTPRIAKGTEKKWPENVQWICVYCRLVNKSLRRYKAHLQLHHRQEDPCCCKHCKREFRNVELFKFHWCRHNRRCNICHLTFSRPNRFRKHMAAHYNFEVEKVVCKLCEEAFASATLCAIHVYDDHETIVMCDSCMTEIDPTESAATSSTRVFCKNCSETATKTELEAIPTNVNPEIVIRGTRAQRQAAAVKKEVLHCDICDKDVYGNTKMKRHLASLQHNHAVKKMLGDTCPEFPCDQCGKIFIIQESLTKHARVHAPGHKATTYKCKICDRELMTIGGYKTHMISHVNTRNFACSECDSAFNLNCHLRDHINNCHRPDKWFPCSVCDEKFRTRRIRLKHISMVHKNYVYVCSHCENFETRNGSMLKHHLAVKHPEVVWTKPLDYRRVSDKPYTPNPRRRSEKPEVSHSDNPETSSSELDADESTEHVRKSVGLQGKEPKEKESKVYSCVDCPKTFVSTKTLQVHILKYHTEDVPRYECNHSGCDKAYLRPRGLRRHRLSHSSSKPDEHGNQTFVCSKCDMKFSALKLLTDHMDREHAEQNNECCEESEDNSDNEAVSMKPIQMKKEADSKQTAADDESTSVVVATQKTDK